MINLQKLQQALGEPTFQPEQTKSDPKEKAGSEPSVSVTNAEGTAATQESAGVSSFSSNQMLILPSGQQTITSCAADLFNRMALSGKVFTRGGVVTVLAKNKKGEEELEILKASKARSEFEHYGKLLVWRSSPRGAMVLKPTTCALDMADALLNCGEARYQLPEISGLLNCPIIREDNGVLATVGPGYDPVTKLFVTGGTMPPEVDLKEAVEALRRLLSDYDFQSPADESRALASFVAPALKEGGFIKSQVPVDVAQADQSQSGKTYRQKVTAAIFNENVAVVTNRKGGVGSVDESLDQKLIAGRPFIQFDNFRGRFSSEHIEAFLTADRDFGCRVPHRGEVKVDRNRYFVFLSSNGVDTTRDFANRSSIIQIRKQREGFKFKQYAEGDLLAHVRANQGYYLGCVFAVVKAWHQAGRCKTDETRHDFREWVQIMDWIVRHIFGGAPIMDGHRTLQANVSSPALVFLRSVAIGAEEQGELGTWFTATDIYKVCQSGNIPVPGLDEGEDEDKAARVIGGLLAKVFGDEDLLLIDAYQIDRTVEEQARQDGQGTFSKKLYHIQRRGSSNCATPQ